MHDTIVQFKNGEELCGPIMTWRPELGWFTVWDGFKEREVRLEDVQSAVTPAARVSIHGCADRDELQRAKDDIALMSKNAPD